MIESIPKDELAKYMNQVDLYNLVLLNKLLKQRYQPYLNKIKAFFSTRANCLSIYGYVDDNYKYEAAYTYRNGSTDLIEPGKYTITLYEGAVLIAIKIMNEISVKVGDIIKFRNLENIKSAKDATDYSVFDYFRYVIFFVSDDKSISVCYQNNAIFSISINDYSIYHWIDLLKSFILDIPYIIQSHSENYIEIDAGDFYYSIAYDNTKSARMIAGRKGHNPSPILKYSENRCFLLP